MSENDERLTETLYSIRSLTETLIEKAKLLRNDSLAYRIKEEPQVVADEVLVRFCTISGIIEDIDKLTDVMTNYMI